MATSHVQIDKLLGRENYNTWKFAVQTYLQHEDLWDCIEPTEKCSVVNPKTDLKAKSKIILLLDPINYIHVQNATTAKEVWQNLQKAFEDSGLTRKVGLLRDLVNTTLEGCASVEEYVNKIVTTAYKLRNISFSIDDEWLGTLMLAGLPEKYKPMIMGLESSGVKITTDFIKTKLLQEVKEPTDFSVLHTKHNKYHHKNKYTPKAFKSTKSPGPRCYNCNQYGHFSKFCKQEKRKSNDGKGFAAVFSTSQDKISKTTWIVDSGASLHMTNVSDGMYNIRAPPIQSITVANNTSITVQYMGSVDLDLVGKDGNINHVQVKDILYVPQLNANLLSVNQLVNNGCQVVFNKTGCEIFSKQQTLVATAKIVNSMYKLNTYTGNAFVASSEENSLNLWHKRMGHLNYNDVQRLPLCTEGVKLADNKDINKNCISCIKGKQTRFPFSNVGSRATKTLQIVHSDLCGPMEVPSMGGAKYYITFIDDYTKKVYVYFLIKKCDTLAKFKEFKNEVENQLNSHIKILRTDNGLEYVNEEFSNYLKSAGIIHQTTTPYTPEQNGTAERMNRTLIERAKCMLLNAKLPKQYWADAVHTAAYIINRSPTKSLSFMTPEELWSGQKPNIKHMRIFGCKAMVHVPKEKRRKWDSKSIEMIFLGYCENTKGYRLVDPRTQRVTKSRNVTFFEDSQKDDNVLLPEFNTSTSQQIPVPLDVPAEITDNAVTPGSPTNEDDCNSILCESFNSMDDDPTYEPSTDCSFDSSENVVNLRPRAGRCLRYNNEQEEETRYANLASNLDPLTLEEALSSPESNQWKKAMEDEFKSLEKNNTWILCDLPPGKRAILCKWVFKTKRNDVGQIAKYKARLVIKGCSQRKGYDYNEVYSPVIRHSSLRYLLSLAVKYNLDIDQMDAVSAFLQGDIEENIYMVQPPNYEVNNTQVCLLKKSLYGLKQASRQWNQKLDKTIKEIGLIQSLLDPCIYHKVKNEDITFVAVYVDDIILLSSCLKTKNYIKNHLASKFEMKDLGELKYCLGFHVHRDRNDGILCVDQKIYIEDILSKYGMSNCKTVRTPIDPKTKFSNDDESSDSIGDTHPYQELIGCLLYLSQCTRPDISFAVNTLSRFNSKPKMEHWVALKRILRYLKFTVNYTLTYKKDDKGIHGYCDADWCSDEIHRRSCTGYIFIHQGAAITWNSRRQPTVALSTTEAEYMSLSSCTQEAMWLKQMQDEFWPQLVTEPVTILCDNQSAIKLAGSFSYHSRTKHIDIRHHFVRDKVRLKKIVIKYIQTSQMVADALTKGTPQLKLDYCSSKMGLCLREDIGM